MLAAEIIVGVNTHMDSHTAGARDALGARLATTTVPATQQG
jgi:hypothetical protein